MNLLKEKMATIRKSIMKKKFAIIQLKGLIVNTKEQVDQIMIKNKVSLENMQFLIEKYEKQFKNLKYMKNKHILKLINGVGDT